MGRTVAADAGLNVVGTSTTRMPEQRRLDDHLRGHTPCLSSSCPFAETHRLRNLEGHNESLELGTVKEQAADRRQYRVSNVPILPRHRAFPDAPAKRLPMTRS